jgi:hypothetical protein
MSRKSAEILMDDEEMDVFGFMLQALGYDYTSTDVKFGKNLIDRENVEKNFHVLEKMVQNRSFRRAPYFAIGYLIMTTGAHMPEALRQDILENARWEHEEGRWLDEGFAACRRTYLKDFRDKIYSYTPGQRFFPMALDFSIKEIGTAVLNPQQLQNAYESNQMLDIRHVNLAGWGLKDIPEEIFKFSELKTLCLEHNQLSEIPEEVGTFHSMKHLDFNDNEISVLPNSIGELEELISLCITNNPISSLPKTLKNLKNLEHVYVRGTQITKKPEIFKDARFDDYTRTIYLKEFYD